MKVKNIFIGTFIFFVSSFIIQGIFAMLIANEYFKNIEIMRKEPMMLLSMGSTIISGIFFTILYSNFNVSEKNINKGLKFGFFSGMIIIPFIALDIPGRFNIPNYSIWIIIQSSLGLLHYIVSGILISVLYKNKRFNQ